MANTVRFPSRNQQVLSSSLIITIGKTSTVKNLSKPGMVVNRANINHINLPHTKISRLAGYIHQPPSCLGIRQAIAWGNVPIFKKAGTTRRVTGLLRLTIQHG